MKYISLFENYIENFNIYDLNSYKNIFHKEYISYYGEDILFSKYWDKIKNLDFYSGGFKNIKDGFSLSRLINSKNIMSSNLHWIRREDENLFYDEDWLFLTGIEINDNIKIIRIDDVKMEDVDWYNTILQNLTFPHEKEIKLSKSFLMSEYKIINYK